MKRVLLTLLFSLLTATALAQNVERLVVLPFNALGSAEAYGLGLATGVQRSLNVLDNVYVPTIGDTLLVTQRLQSQERLSSENVVTAFGASVIISGQITAQGNQADVLLGFAGPRYPEIKDLSVQGPLDEPQQLLQVVIDAVINELGLRVSGDDRRQLNAVIAQTPSLPSLQAVARAALRLPGNNLTELNAAAQLDPASSWVLSEQARALALAGDGPAALENSLTAIQLEPNDIEALIIRAIILRSAGELEVAQQAFDAALQINPAHALALEGKGQLSGDAAQAQQLFEASLNSYPRLVNAYLDLASLQRGQSEQRTLQTLRRGAQAIPESVTLHGAVIRQALRLGDSTGALTYLRQVLSEEANLSPALYSLAALLPSEFSTEALELLSAGKTRYPQSDTIALAEAEVLESSGDNQSAEAVLTEAFAFNPESSQLANALAILQARNGKIEAAKTTLESVAGQNPTVRVNLAQLYLQAGQSQAAINTLEPLLQRSPDDAELYVLYGIALGRSGRYEQALNSLDQALALNPESSSAQGAKAAIEQQRELTKNQAIELNQDAAVAFEAGLSALGNGELEQAAQNFAQASELQDNSLIAFYQGYALQRSGQIRAALPLYERALEDFPESDTVLNNLGYGYLQLGRYDLALDYLKRAVAADPENTEAQVNIGLTYYSLARYAQAVSAWETALSLDAGLESSIGNLLEDARTKAAE